MSSITVSLVSLLCILLQFLYIVSILWLFRLRSRRMLESHAKLPPLTPALAAAAAGGRHLEHPDTSVHTNTHTAFYNRFLPDSFQSVAAPTVGAGAANGAAAATSAAAATDARTQQLEATAKANF